MESQTAPPADPATGASDATQTPGSATYDIIRQRLTQHAATVQDAVTRMDADRRAVFGSVESKLLQSDRVNTAHNCIPKDMVQLGNKRFLFGFNIVFGLKKTTDLTDVFGLYERDESTGMFREDDPAPVLNDPKFLADFQRLFSVYDQAAFQKFSIVEGRLFMVFQTSASPADLAVFQWGLDEGHLKYVDGRAESEFRRIGFPPQYNFTWTIPNREAYRYGDFPHISIADRVFVECTGGNLTIKIEDNTKTGEGVYSEPVDDARQKVDDAEIAYAILGHLILLKIRPYKERGARYILFNEKLHQTLRIDSIGDSCAALPNDQGIIFPDGYYLGTGRFKSFGSEHTGHVLERVIHAPNGEDSLFVFYSQASGEYVLMPYRLIEQIVDERIACHGFSLFPNGHLLLFRADAEPQKHHLIQLRQTPFYQPGYEPEGHRDRFLYQVGNREVVRCLAEIHEILTLVRREEPYAELYADLVKRCTCVLDAYPWLSNHECFGLDRALQTLRESANRAIDEFDKVLRQQKEAGALLAALTTKTNDQLQAVRRATFQALDDFVLHLSALRTLTGELITAGETRYINVEALKSLGAGVSEETTRLSNACVAFLLKPEAMAPYRDRAEALLSEAQSADRVATLQTLESEVQSTSTNLEMLIEMVNGLQIADASESTRIIDHITAVYTTLNQIRGVLKNRRQSLGAAEGAARFAAQVKLLAQTITSYLDLCDTPAKCEEYLNRVSVQIEEMEGTFADFDDFLIQIADRRTAAYEAFEQKKVALTEARSRRAMTLVTTADRVLKVVGNKLNALESVEAIRSYIASDRMVSKVRETIAQLLALDDPIRADDLSTQLKGLEQEAVRQLRDRQELFTGGPGVIQLGRHQFNVNSQPLDLTIVLRDGLPFVHLTGTRYFDPINDPEFLATREIWDQELVSENASVYRAETLARRFFESLETDTEALASILDASPEDRLSRIQSFMAPRYEEGYVRGIHDLDAEKIFAALARARSGLELARFHPDVRACAMVFWVRFCPADVRELWTATLTGFASRNRTFPGDPVQSGYIDELRGLVSGFLNTTQLFPSALAAAAGEYLFYEITSGREFVLSREGDELVQTFRRHLVTKGADAQWNETIGALKEFPAQQLRLIRDWLRGFVREFSDHAQYLEESAATLFCGDGVSRKPVTASTGATLSGMKGSHPLIVDGNYRFDFLDFESRLDTFEATQVPMFHKYHRLKQNRIAVERSALRLEEFQPRVLSTFVRNQLIDKVYLPLVGDNLAKQIGTASDTRRTDRSGLLLLVSPPGYGKTTLLEYLASRLGVIFVKINGPALGFQTRSLDPAEAPNAAAREEIEKLNLALEMGDNVLICIDDIQHCSSEFLQKFISLCDAQRKIESVWRGSARTVDLRGRKVAIAMAGNPYTETGQRFRIPDMLANRADTYNLGDIIGGNAAWFKASYIENAITSNPVLAPLANRSQKDIRQFLQIAESGIRDESGFESAYSPAEVDEVLAVLKKLILVREVVLAVNLEYIRSAAQSDEFRTEPPFKLQGSYRNMNRLAEKIVSIMDDGEVQALIFDHYRNESQTLTSDTEANLLKLRELLDILTPQESARWEEIKSTFQRNLLTKTGDDSDPMGRVVGQLSAFGAGLDGIQRTIAEAAKSMNPASASKQMSPSLQSVLHELEMIHSTLAALQNLSIQQRDELKSSRDQLEQRAKQGVIEVELTDELLANQEKFLDHFQSVLASKRPNTPSAETP